LKGFSVSDHESVQKRRDAIVGIFVIVGLAALAWMVFRFGDLPTAVTRMRSFQIYVQFPTAPGVQKDTPVRFCGYQVGMVTEVKPPRVRVDLNTKQPYHQTLCVLSISKQYTDIPSNVEVKLMTRGLGSSYLELKVDPRKLPAPPLDPNDSGSYVLKNGMLLQGSTGMTSEFFPEESQEQLSKLVEDIRTFIANANSIIGDPNNKEHLTTTLANIAQVSGDMPTAIDQAVETLKSAQETLSEFRRLARAGSETLKGTDAKAERLVASLVNTSNELGRTVAQLRLAVEKVNHGDGSAGRLLNDGRLYESLLESTTQLNVLLKDLKDLTDRISEKGLRSVY
jgi:phospholipid/cholesterol/gamma-HCH transport system substrate-binding protein